MTAYYKSVSRVIPSTELQSCQWCGNEKPELVKLVQEDHESFRVICPVCGKRTCTYVNGEVETGDVAAVREWNGVINSIFWMCRHCHATNVGLYYKFCPYCGEERHEDIG